MCFQHARVRCWPAIRYRFLVHVDQADLSDEYLSQGARCRYVSRAYLGASRAARRLVIASCMERGGGSAILNAPLPNQSLLLADS